MTRCVENAYFIQEREEGYADKTIAEIVREICDLHRRRDDVSKKDHLVNIGGFLAVNDDELADKARNMVVVYEGCTPTAAWPAATWRRSPSASASASSTTHPRPRRPGAVPRPQAHRGRHPIVKPIGTHGVFLDAKRFLPHLDQDEFPAQALAAEIYVDSGVRAMERGIVSAGRDPEDRARTAGPKLELVRLTIPRRVYTQAHMDVVAESIIEVYENRDEVKGLEFTYEPEVPALLPGAVQTPHRSVAV
jgi:tyrosine phenol-lyase